MTDYAALQEDLSKAEEESTTTSSSSNEYSNAPILNICPTVAVEHDGITEVSMMGGVKEEQNVRKSGEQGNDIVVTLKNPTVGEGELYSSNQDSGADYKLVDPDHHRVKKDIVEGDDGEFVTEGVQVYGHDFKSDKVDDFEEDEVRLMIGSAAGQRIAQLLDVKGGVSAYYDGEDKTEGLIEYPPEYGNDDYNPRDNDTDRYPRVARTPTLRDDISGEGVFFFYMDEDTGMHKAQIFDGEASVENKVEIINDGGEPEWNPYIVWDEPDEDGEESESEETSTSTDEPDEDDLDLSSLEADEGSDVVESYSDLSDAQQAFFDKLADNEAIDVEEADVSHIYSKFAADNDDVDELDANVVEDIAVEHCA